MVNKYQKQRAIQHHIDEIAKMSGPVYGVRLIDSLPLRNGSMRQACPNRTELEAVRDISERTVAAYEVLLDHYAKQTIEIERLKDLIRDVISGDWCVTDLQESIGEV